MPLEVYLTASALTPDAVKGRTVVVIDVLRAASTIIAALKHGARSVIPVADMAEASRIASAVASDSLLLGGERGGVPIEGYSLGNSPAEYTEETVSGRNVVLNTSHGTAAIKRAGGAARLVVAGFLNAFRAVEVIRQSEDVVLVCVGHNGRVAVEDVLCAGLLLHTLAEGRALPDVNDAGHVALTTYRADKNRIERAVHQSDHAKRLVELGYGDDVAFCLQVDAIPVLPEFDDNRLVLRDATPRRRVAV